MLHPASVLPLEAEKVSVVHAGGVEAIIDVSLALPAGELCAVLGPNGAGKSTLLRALAGTVAPTSGVVRLFGEDVAALARRDIARRVAVVPQSVEVALGFRVRDVVAMGRAPHQGPLQRATEADRDRVNAALARADLEALAERRVDELSGGEQRRVALARAFAQGGDVLLLDEPTAHLDLRHANDLYELLRREVDERKVACLVVLHDPNAAAQWADRVVLLQRGRIVARGTVPEVMTYERLRSVFETDLYVGVNELDDTRYFVPMRRR